MGNKLFEDAFLRAQMSHMSGFNNLCMKFAIQSTHVEYLWQFYRRFASWKDPYCVTYLNIMAWKCLSSSHCAFSSNLFHGQIAQIKTVTVKKIPDTIVFYYCVWYLFNCNNLYIRPSEWIWKQKCSPWKVDELTTLKRSYFWAGEALEAQKRGCFYITLAHEWHSGIFQISTESFSAWQKSSCTFLYSFGGCNLQK